MGERPAGTEWRIERRHDLWVEIRTGYGFGNRMVADCVFPGDAKLIAAAPDLLAACDALLPLAEEHSVRMAEWGSDIVDTERMQAVVREASAAIARARGGKTDG